MLKRRKRGLNNRSNLNVMATDLPKRSIFRINQKRCQRNAKKRATFLSGPISEPLRNDVHRRLESLPACDDLETRVREPLDAKPSGIRNVRIPRLTQYCGMRKRLSFPMNSYWLAGSDFSGSASSGEREMSRTLGSRSASEADDCLPFSLCRFSMALIEPH